MKELRIALLATMPSRILGYIINSFLDYKIPIHSIIIDSKEPTKKDELIWEERTKGQLPEIPMKQFEKEQIPLFFFPDHSSTEVVEFVKESRIDLLINAGTPRILKGEIIDAPKIGIINCHPGLLPHFRGCTTVEWAIYLDESIGNTVHLMTEEIDQGPIIIKEKLFFKKSDKYHDIRVKTYKHGFDLLARGVKEILDNPEIDLKNQEYYKNGTYFKVIDDEKMKKILEKINSGNYISQSK